MNKSDLISKVTERLGGDRTTATAAVNGMLEEIEGSVARGERVSLSGFGTFDRRERAPRLGRNPRTGEAVHVGPSVVPVFRPGTGFRTLVTQTDGASASARSAAVENGVTKTKVKKLQAASSPSLAEVADVDADALVGKKKKADKKARDRAGEKNGKGGKKTANNKSGKKAVKGLR